MLMWSDLTLVSQFILNTVQAVITLVMSGGILICSVGLWILGLVVKFFRRIL